MKNLKFLFLSLFMVAFLAPNVVNAQATTAWIEGDGVGIQIDGVQYKFTSQIKHKVITANGMINYVAYGLMEDQYEGPDDLVPGMYKDSRDFKETGVDVKLWVYEDGTFKAIATVKGKKLVPVGPPEEE